jgi:hypothetical protein
MKVLRLAAIAQDDRLLEKTESLFLERLAGEVVERKRERREGKY